ncbi:MAG: response regulator transcription factor [Chitinophagaceae bacterium]|nr:response regulator transcription factor [Anaerolineae bacterium]
MMSRPNSSHVRPLILVVDDEARTREVIRKYLELSDFRVLEAENSDQALRIIQHNQLHLILLDVMLPGMDGFAITQLLRDQEQAINSPTSHGDIPIILITARKEEIDRVFGFEIGADDYVVKPFSPRELVGRVKAILRRGDGSNRPKLTTLHFGGYQLDPASRTLMLNGVSVALTTKDFDILFFLASHPNQVFTHEQLLTSLWTNAADLDSSVVTSRIYRLREKIETDPDNPIFLQTVWGVGYKFQND